MKKLNLILFFIMIFSFNLKSAEFSVYFIYNGTDRYVSLNEKKEIPITPFDPMIEIDQSQKHRLILTSLEKSTLASLFYVGDKYKLDNIEITLIFTRQYKIIDLINNFTLTFSIGKYDNIILESAVNFGDKKFDIIDKFASAFAIKLLLKRLIGKPQKEEFVKNKIHDETTKNNSTEIENSEQAKEYYKFIEQLKNLNNKELLNYLTKYVKLNFQLSTDKSITSDWINPINLYFYKKGDYKSCAFFYYNTLKELGFKVRSYLVSYLIKKNEEEIEEMYNIFEKRDKERVQEIEIQYRHVNPESNIVEFDDKLINRKNTKPPLMFFYKPPDFKSAIYLVAVEIDDKWIYTTGINWIDSEIYKPERVCSNYSRSGCYYAGFENDYYIKNNLPLNDDDFIWDIYYPQK